VRVIENVVKLLSLSILEEEKLEEAIDDRLTLPVLALLVLLSLLGATDEELDGSADEDKIELLSLCATEEDDERSDETVDEVLAVNVDEDIAEILLLCAAEEYVDVDVDNSE
jgi:hypothetical protein